MTTRSRGPAPDFAEELEAAKAGSTMQLLFRCARLINDEGLRRVREKMGKPVRPSHAALFPLIDLQGSRITDLAARLGISKQAVGQLVDDLEEMDMVERVPDPDDGRARLVRFSKRGRRGLIDGLQILTTIETELAATIGATEMKRLHTILTRLLPVVESDTWRTS